MRHCSSGTAHQALLIKDCPSGTPHQGLPIRHCSSGTAHQALLIKDCPSGTAHQGLPIRHCSTPKGCLTFSFLLADARVILASPALDKPDVVAAAHTTAGMPGHAFTHPMHAPMPAQERARAIDPPTHLKNVTPASPAMARAR